MTFASVDRGRNETLERIFANGPPSDLSEYLAVIPEVWAGVRELDEATRREKNPLEVRPWPAGLERRDYPLQVFYLALTYGKRYYDNDQFRTFRAKLADEYQRNEDCLGDLTRTDFLRWYGEATGADFHSFTFDTYPAAVRDFIDRPYLGNIPNAGKILLNRGPLSTTGRRPRKRPIVARTIESLYGPWKSLAMDYAIQVHFHRDFQTGIRTVERAEEPHDKLSAINKQSEVLENTIREVVPRSERESLGFSLRKAVMSVYDVTVPAAVASIALGDVTQGHGFIGDLEAGIVAEVAMRMARGKTYEALGRANFLLLPHPRFRDFLADCDDALRRLHFNR